MAKVKEEREREGTRRKWGGGGGGGGYACHHNYLQVDTNKGSTFVQSSLV